MMHNSSATVWEFSGKHLGPEIHVFDTLDSTNTHALALADDPLRNGVVLLARSQTAGRGQYGRTWIAPPESSVLLSVLLFPPPTLRRPAILTAWAAVAVCESILRLTNLQAKIKWPNDVLLHGKKVCGILIEQRTTGNPEFPLATVAGIGLNVMQSAIDFEGAGLPDAASLSSSTGQRYQFENVAKELISELDQQYHLLLEGDLQTLESLWQWRLGLLGKYVIAEGLNQIHRGRLIDATFDGVSIDSDGEILLLPPEVIRQLRAE